jgi:hypothetical protein
MALIRHGRTRSGHPRLACKKEDMDARTKSAHDAEREAGTRQLLSDSLFKQPGQSSAALFLWGAGCAVVLREDPRRPEEPRARGTPGSQIDPRPHSDGHPTTVHQGPSAHRSKRRELRALDRRALTAHLRCKVIRPATASRPAGIHVFLRLKTWMAGTSPAMTRKSAHSACAGIQGYGFQVCCPGSPLSRG